MYTDLSSTGNTLICNKHLMVPTKSFHMVTNRQEVTMIAHEFLLCTKVPDSIGSINSYKDELVFIDDDFVLNNHIPFLSVKMYHNSIGNIAFGLNYYGITILDDRMAEELKRELINFCSDCDDLQKLVRVLNQAIEQKRYIIHFGV